MRKFFLLPLLAFAAMLLLAPGFMNDAVADSRIIVKPNGAKKFAALPSGVTNPEGITINTDNGEVIVATFSPLGDATLMRVSSEGRLLGSKTIPQDHGALLGLAYNGGFVYICNAAVITNFFTGGGVDAGVSRIERISADLSGSIEIVTTGGAADPTMVADTVFLSPNDLTFDSADNLYFSDSFAGTVIKVVADDNTDADDDPFTCAPTCAVETVASDPLLTTTGFPSFGANGVAFNADESVLFVANTGNDTVLTVDPSNGDVAVLAQSINGADGAIFDTVDNLLWVAGNQADQVVAIDPDTGRVVAEIGEFLGIKPDGSARGLIFPASLVQAANGKILVTNLALPLVGDGSEPEEDVTKGTVSFINIPEFDD